MSFAHSLILHPLRQAVVPFGFGLSYSSFGYAVSSDLTGSLSLDPLRELLEATYKAGRTFPDAKLLKASKPLVNYWVNVTNTGKMDADDVVLGFLKPPGAGENGVPLQTLFGFERVHVKAGETKTVYLYPALSKFKTVAEDGALAARPGDYTIEFGIPETRGRMGYAAATLVAF